MKRTLSAFASEPSSGRSALRLQIAAVNQPSAQSPLPCPRLSKRDAMRMKCALLACVALGLVVCLVQAQTAPTLTSVTPSQTYNYAATTVTIAGSGFQATPTVTLNETPLSGVTLVDATTLTAVVPPGLLQGSYALTVTNPDNSAATLAGAFTVSSTRSGDLSS